MKRVRFTAPRIASPCSSSALIADGEPHSHYEKRIRRALTWSMCNKRGHDHCSLVRPAQTNLRLIDDDVCSRGEYRIVVTPRAQES